ncbi:hypothetical protein COFR110785_08360 [Corynebacterium frankenforstense]
MMGPMPRPGARPCDGRALSRVGSTNPETKESELCFSSMELKIGFKDTPRELVIDAKGDAGAVSGEVRSALERGEGILELEDQRGQRYLLRVSEVAYAAVGADTPRTVGFAGA